MSEGLRFLSSTVVPYGDNLFFRCQFVTDFENPRSLNLLEYYDEDRAHEVVKKWSNEAVQIILDKRAEPINDSIEFPNGILAHRFVTQSLRMQLVGRLAFVKSYPEREECGITSFPLRTSYVMQDKIFQSFSNWPIKLSAEQKYQMNMHRAATVAVHELTHLAGAQDRIFLRFNDTHKQCSIDIPGSTLEGWPVRTGNYFEEGFACMVGNAYSWIFPDARERISTRPFQSPSGIRVNLPERHEYAGRQAYPVAGWGMECLTKAIPETWDILLRSRRYEVGWLNARMLLRNCIDSASPGLFDYIDSTDTDDLDQVFDTTRRLEHLAQA